jgi:hypothetical protein
MKTSAALKIFKPNKTMNAQETIDQLKQLKLKGMMQAYQTLLELPSHQQVSLHPAVARLAEAELQYRVHQKTQMYLKLSKLRYNAVLENVQCSEARNFTKEQLLYFTMRLLLNVRRTCL